METQDGAALPTKTRKGYVYGLVCLCGECDPAKVVYVGQTTRDPEYRRRAHRDASRRPTHNDYFNVKSQWIREHAYNTLGVVVLAQSTDLNTGEDYWITKLNTLYPSGLNTYLGGHRGAGSPGESNPGAKLTEKQVREIIERIGTDTTVTSRSLAKEYGVTKTLILKIDIATLWPDLERPYGLNLLSRNRKRTTPAHLQEKACELYEAGGTVSGISRKLGLGYGATRNALVRGGLL